MRPCGWLVVAINAVGCGDASVDVDDSTTGTSSGSETTPAQSSSGVETSGGHASTGAVDEASTTTTDTTGDPPLPGEGPFGAGTRLTPVYDESTDGQRRLLYWHDDEIGIDCRFMGVPGGEYRCAPKAVPYDATFADNACTQPAINLGTVLRPGPPPSAVSLHDFRFGPERNCPDEPPGFLPFTVAEPVAPDVPQYRRQGLLCVFGDPSSFTRYALEPIAIDALVGASVIDEPIGDGIGLRILLGDDGSWERTAPIEIASATTCLEEDGICVSTSRGVGRNPSLFADDTCMGDELAVASGDERCAPPVLLALDDERFAVGRRSEQAWWQVGAGPCQITDAALELSGSFYARGELLGTDAFPAIIREPLGASRLRLPMLTTSSGELVVATADQTWFDTELEAPCSAVPRTPTTVVCAPEVEQRFALGLRYWGDAACVDQPLVLRSMTDPIAAAIVVVDDGGIAVEAWGMPEPWIGPVHRLDDDSGCQPYEPLPFAVALALVGPLALDDLGSLTRVNG